MDDPYDDDDEDALPSFRHRWDVFLSFRGTDTRHNFTNRLYNELVLHGVRTFRDEECLEGGDEVGQGLLDAIEDSAAAIAVISEKYAHSRWCLEELATIFERRKLLLPIFYRVNPSDLRGQKLSLLPKLEEKWGKEKVLRWREAMEKAADISGWVSQVWEEQDLIRAVVNRILKKLRNTPLGLAECPVGIDTRVEQLRKMLDANTSGVLIVGLYGTGGIGKTTLAKALYNKIIGRFKYRGFIPDVRENSKQEGGLQKLQSKLIRDLSTVKEFDPQVKEVTDGIVWIQKVVLDRQVLIVLDDVCDASQVNALAGSRDWFSKGSLIIITSRDKDALPEGIVNVHYEVEELNPQESLQLFSFHAFGRDKPFRSLTVLTEEIVSLTGGLPLALEVFGCFLHGKRRTEEWTDALQKLKRNRPCQLQTVLEISFDSLDGQEKNMFLDIACFFLKMKMTREDAVYVFRACGFNPEISIKVLVAKSLLKVVKNDFLWMHDQIRDMAKEIVLKESNDHPSMRSRLWEHDEILRVLKSKKGSPMIQGITLGIEKKLVTTGPTDLRTANLNRKFNCILYLKQLLTNTLSFKEEDIQTKSFEAMPNLRLLQIDHVAMHGSFKLMPCQLRWLQWKGCPMEALRFDRFPENLGVLNLSNSTSLTSLWKWNQWNSRSREKMAKKLLVLDLQNCVNLTELPSLSGFQVLEKLILRRCKGLVRIHASVGDLPQLVTLDLSGCSNLVEFPVDVSGLKNLQKLNLSGCIELKQLPEDVSGMRSLMELILDYTAIEQVPHSIFRLQNLEKLSLENCMSLKQLPFSIGKVKSLKELNLTGSALEELPESIGFLDELTLLRCSSLISLPDSIGCLKSLTHLYLSGNALAVLPSSIGKLSRLKYLSLSSCRKLTSLPDSIGGLSSLIRFSCHVTPIEALPTQIGSLKMLQHLSLAFSDSLTKIPESVGNLLNITSLVLDGAPIIELPESIGNLQKLRDLRMQNCRQLRRLPSSMGNLKSLESLVMTETLLLALPDNFGMLSRLKLLKMSKEPFFQTDIRTSLPLSFSSLCSLEELDAHGWRLCGKISDEFERLTSLRSLKLGYNDFHALPSSLRGLKLLKTLNLTNCESLKSLPLLPSGLESLILANCTALENVAGLENLENLQELDMTNCCTISDVPDLEVMKSLTRLFLGGCKSCLPAIKKRLKKGALKRLYNLCIPGSYIPSWFAPEITNFTAPRNRELKRIIFAVVISLSDQNPNNIKSKLKGIVDVKAEIVRGNVRMHSFTLKLSGVPNANEDQLYVIQFPEFRSGLVEEGDMIRISLQDPPYFPGIQLKKQGICLVFENDDDYDGDEDWIVNASELSFSHKLTQFIGSI